MNEMISKIVEKNNNKEYENLVEILNDILKVAKNLRKEPKKEKKIITENDIAVLAKCIDDKLCLLKEDEELWLDVTKKDILENPRFNMLNKELQKSWQKNRIPSRENLLNMLIETKKVFKENLSDDVIETLLHSGGYDGLSVRIQHDLDVYLKLKNIDAEATTRIINKNKYIECLLYSTKQQNIKKYLDGLKYYSPLFSIQSNSSKNSKYYNDELNTISKLFKTNCDVAEYIKKVHDLDKANTLFTSNSNEIDEYKKITKKEKLELEEIQVITYFQNEKGKLDSSYHLLIPISIYLMCNYRDISFLGPTEVRNIDKELYKETFGQIEIKQSGTNDSEKGKMQEIDANTLIKLLLNKANAICNEYISQTHIVKQKLDEFFDTESTDGDAFDLLVSIFPLFLSERSIKINNSIDDINVGDNEHEDKNIYVDDIELKKEDNKKTSKKEAFSISARWKSIDKKTKMTEEDLSNVVKKMRSIANFNQSLNSIREKIIILLFFGFSCQRKNVNKILEKNGFSKLTTKYLFDSLLLSADVLRTLIDNGIVINSQGQESFSSAFKILYSNCDKTNQKVHKTFSMFSMLHKDPEKEYKEGKKLLFDYYKE